MTFVTELIQRLTKEFKIWLEGSALNVAENLADEAKKKMR